MKKLLPLILMLAGAALLFTGCPKDAPEEPVSQPAETPETPDTPAEKTWITGSASAALTNDGVGTAEAVLSAAYNGNALVVYINDDKSEVAAGKTLHVVFDYAPVEGAWEKSDVMPKFVLKYGSDTAKYYELTTAADYTDYYDAATATGTVEKDVPLSIASKVVSVQFNAYEWAGGDNDKLKVVLKEVTVK